VNQVAYMILKPILLDLLELPSTGLHQQMLGTFHHLYAHANLRQGQY